MGNPKYVARNRALDFAERTKVNLEFIEKAKSEGAAVHVVTQLANSLLGLIVFVWEKTFVDHIKELRMDKLISDGWPSIEVKKGTNETLYEFVRHLRNAVAHGRIRFSSDSPDPRQVTIEIDDCKSHEETPYWSARMKASDLRQFCLNFIGLLEDTIG
jgi:HEPN family protein